MKKFRTDKKNEKYGGLRKCCCAFFLALLLLPGVVLATDYYVKSPAAGGDNNNPGLDWNTAKATIQAALDMATSAGDRVLVAEGTYNERIILPAHNNFQLLGGYPSAGGTQEPWSHPTVIDGHAVAGTVVFVPGDIGASLGYSGLLIDGFTIQNGSKNGTYGTALESYSIDLTIKRCVVQNNTNTNGYVGGIYANALMNETSFSTLRIEESIIRNNSGPYFGGVVIDSIGYPTIEITNCLINGNHATVTTGPFSVGGVTIGTGSQDVAIATITNSSIVDNTSANTSHPVGGIAINLNYHLNVVDIKNSIIWNTADDIYDVNSGDDVQLSYSDISDSGDSGTGVIHTDPAFAGGFDYHITSGSGCIDTGTAAGAPGIDLEGTVRPQGTQSDMGAYEYFAVTQYTLTTSVDGAHGTLLPASGDYDEGAVVALTATPDFGYQVAAWTGTDDDASHSTSNSVTMDSDKTVMVQFEVASAFTGEIGAITWQKIFNSGTAPYFQAFFNSVWFNSDGSLLVSGYRGEPDSKSAIALHYDAATGDIRDTPAEWFLFEYTYGDYTHDRFYDQFIDSNGNTFFVGVSYGDHFNTSGTRYNCPSIWKYDSAYTNPDPNSGNPERPLWRNYHCDDGHPENNGEFNDMAVDSSGNIYVVGWFKNLDSTTSDRDWIIDKYAGDGTEATGFPLILNKDDFSDYAASIAVDSEDNFIVVGSVQLEGFVPESHHYDWVVRKYNADGTLLWDTEYDYGGNNLNDQALFVVVDAHDDIIVCGYRTNNTTAKDRDWYIVKYGKNGDGSGGASVLWEQFWDDGQNKHGLARGMLLDDQQNIYLIGRQGKDSTDPVYTDRLRPVLQYRDGQTGTLLKSQDIPLMPTHNHSWNIEHDFMYRLARKDGQLVIAGGTSEDANYLTPYSRTGRVVMLAQHFDVTPSSSGNGTISPSDKVERIAYNTTTQFTLTPETGYSPAAPLGTCPAGSLIDNSNGTWTYTTGQITSDCTLIVGFKTGFPWPMFLPAITGIVVP